MFDGFKWLEGGLNLFFAEDSCNPISYSLDVRKVGISIRVLVFWDNKIIAGSF
jgi:hypothetical protein